MPTQVTPGGRRRRRLDPDARYGLRFTVLALGASVTVVVLAVGGALVREQVGFVVDGDTSIEQAAHRAVLSSPWLLDLARWVTHAGDPLTRWAIAVVVVGYLAWRRLWRLVGFYATAVLGGLALVNLVKGLVGRARPTFPDPVAHAGGASFPSGHAMGATVLYGAIFLLFAPLLPRWGRWLAGAVVALLVAAVCASRVLLGVHYTSDVVAGAVLGAAWLVLVVGAFETWRHGLGHGTSHPVTEGVEPAEQRALDDRASSPRSTA